MRKGILLAGGSNSRLYPVTRATAKSLLPIYDKPLIYYSLAPLLQAGLRDILIITAPAHHQAHQRLLGDGSQWGARFSYAVQPQPRGIADAFLIARDFLGGAPSMLMLCDNIFYGEHFPALLQSAAGQTGGASVFAYAVPDPQRFGVVDFDAAGKALSIEEKPAQPHSSYAVTGCYFYDADVCDIAAAVTPSARGELEITAVNEVYLKQGRLQVHRMSEDMYWTDAGTPDSMLSAAQFMQAAQQRQNAVLHCPEEIAWRQGWISDRALQTQADALGDTAYAAYLRRLVR